MVSRHYPVPTLIIATLAIPDDVSGREAVSAIESGFHNACETLCEVDLPPGVDLEALSVTTPEPSHSTSAVEAHEERACAVTELLAWVRVYCDQHGLDYGAVDGNAYDQYLQIRDEPAVS